MGQLRKGGIANPGRSAYLRVAVPLKHSAFRGSFLRIIAKSEILFHFSFFFFFLFPFFAW